MKNIGVVGLGYVGLPLAVQAAEKGYKVRGIDLDAQLINKVNSRVSPYVNDARFERALARIPTERLCASDDFSLLSAVDTIIVCVPTPTDNNVPDLRLVKVAVAAIASVLRPGQLVSLESTVSPGVTRDVVLQILESISSLQAGKDFYLAHCPERIDPGNDTFFVGNLNRVVGGITDACSQRAYDFYRSVIDATIIKMGSAEEAEFVKSWENSHRNVLIALANSAALICDAVGMDIDNVLAGLQSKVDQFGLHLAKPGIGPGGHCIPEDIHYVIKKAREQGVDTRFLDSAAEVNDKMPHYAVHQLSQMISNNGEKLENLNVLLLGVAYKPNVADARRSPAIEVGYLLARKARSLTIHDQYVTLTPSVIKGAAISADLQAALAGADAVVIGCAHDEYLQANLADYKNIRYVYDGRNCLDADAIEKQGMLYKGVGR